MKIDWVGLPNFLLYRRAISNMLKEFLRIFLTSDSIDIAN